MPTVKIDVGTNMATQLGTAGVQGWAVYFDASGTNPVWTQLTAPASGSTSATLNLPNEAGLKVYFILQSMAPGVTPVHNPSSPGTDPIQTESQITPTGTISSAQTLNYRYDSFEVTFTPAAADAGNLTDINGFGIPMGVVVSYTGANPVTSASRGYMISGGAVGTNMTMWDELASAGGAGSIQYYASGGGMSGPRMAISPATALANNVGGTNYATSNWDPYITALSTSSATSSGNAGQIQIAGYFNGAPDGNHVWHNAGFYAYDVTFNGGNFILTPGATSQIQGTITISAADLANSIYMTLGNATVTGLSTGTGTGGTTTLTMNTGANNEWGTVLRDFVAGFTAGYWGGTATSLNPNVSGSFSLNKEWYQDPTYAFGGSITSGSGSVTPFGSVVYDEYAKVFFNETNSYGNGYSDFLTRAYNVGPLINVSDGSGNAVDSNAITVTLYADNDTPSGYTPQVINNYISAGPAGYLAPAGVNTNGIQTTFNFNVGTMGLKAGTPITIILKGATPAQDVALQTITSFNNYKVISNGSGGYALTTYGTQVPGVLNVMDLPVSPVTLGAATNWYQIQVGAGAAMKTFNLYMAVDSSGNIYNPAYNAAQAGAIAIDGLASITGTGTSQFITSSTGMTINFQAGGTNTLDPSLMAVVPLGSASLPNAAYTAPSAPLVGMRPGYTSAGGAPFLESYQAWSVGPTATVYNGGLVFGWKGADNAALQQQTATSNYYVNSYTNKIGAGDVARLFFTSVSGAALPTAIVSNGGYLTVTADSDGNWATGAPVQFGNGTYTVQMQEFLASDSAFANPLNSASAIQTFTVAQGAVVSGYNLSVNTSQTSTGLTIESTGAVTVNGGTTSATMISAGGAAYVANGVDIGAVVLGLHQVWAGASARNMTIASGGSGFVYGTTSAVSINGGGFQYVVGNASQSATAIGTMVNSGGAQYVLSYGWGSGTTVLSGGNQVVGGQATAVSSSFAPNISGGFAMNTTVQSGGLLTVTLGGSAGSSYVSVTSSGGSSTSAILVSGGATALGGDIYVYGGGVTLGALLQGVGTEQMAWSGGLAASTTIQSGANLYVYSAGSATASTVQSGGFELVWGSGSVAQNATVQSAGYEYVYQGAMASNTNVQFGGWQIVWDVGTVASGTLVQSGGFMQAHLGGLVSGMTVLSGGLGTIWTAGSASGTTVNGGAELVGLGGTATGTMVNSGGFQYGYGDTLNTVINSAGSGVTFSGGIFASGQVNAGGTYHVVAGGVASAMTVNGFGAQAYVWSGGSVQGATLNGGYLEILSGGMASGSTVTFGTSGGTLKLDDSVNMSGLSISGLTPTAGAIDFGDIGYTAGVTSASWTQGVGSGTLTLTSGALQASIALFGTYVASSFKLQSDGAVGTLVTDPAVGNDSQNLLTQPHA